MSYSPSSRSCGEELMWKFKVNQRDLVRLSKQIYSDTASVKRSASTLSSGEVLDRIKSLEQRSNKLKRKLEEAELAESTCLDRLQARQEAGNANEQDSLMRLVADQLLRDGLTDTVSALMECTPDLENFIDSDLIGDLNCKLSMLEKRSCGEALQFCLINRSKLAKLNKNELEFRLRRQEFIELLRAHKSLEAVKYARQYFVAGSTLADFLPDIQRSMACVAFSGVADSLPPQLAELFADERWHELQVLFKRDFCAISGLSAASPLSIHLLCGLSALKTSACDEETSEQQRQSNALSSSDCPVCNEFRGDSKKLPVAHHQTSKLMCRILHVEMDASNPPMMLPNGRVYSKNALYDMHERTGTITCPVTGDECALEDLRKVFIV